MRCFVVMVMISDGEEETEENCAFVFFYPTTPHLKDKSLHEQNTN